ncbi:MAG: alginate O-acetyltransferase complex protein AlgI [Solirubrobacteraceae bacterium]|nr:alginate O-acetyltransferase complex protein AlgI [Solirubrobacteraceae bacterium]
MVFPSVEFAVFFPVVLGLSWLLMPRPRAWKAFILAASYVFYAAADVRFCALLAAVTLVNQAGAVLVGRARADRSKNLIVAVTVGLDLLALGFFKYYGFFVTNVDELLRDAGLGAPAPLLAVALPVGLSFFTFQAISYIVDVRRGTCDRATTVDLAIYLSFFPHLVAGPIVRAREFLPQLRTPRDPRDVAVGAGVMLIIFGLVKKVVIADFLARNAVDPVFAVPEAYGAPDAWTALMSYAVQIYCDFSGYTDIAIGLALLMGFIFPQNFDRPYRSLSVREFWRRWHMTLSRFLRDFIYIPLGGNREGQARTIRNLMITMLLGGLWHGAAWGFVLWGALHGAALSLEHLRRGRSRKVPPVAAWAATFLFVCLAWIPFRAPNLDTAWAFTRRLFTPGPVTLLTPGIAVAVVGVLALQLVPERPLDRLRERLVALPPVALGTGLAVTVALVAAAVPGNAVPPFIYFQF